MDFEGHDVWGLSAEMRAGAQCAAMRIPTNKWVVLGGCGENGRFFISRVKSLNRDSPGLPFLSSMSHKAATALKPHKFLHHVARKATQHLLSSTRFVQFCTCLEQSG